MRYLNTVMQDLREVTRETDFPPAPGRVNLSARGWIVRAGLVVAVLGLVLGTYLWSAGAQQRAIGELHPGERQALYLRTVENLKSVCSPAPDSMRDFCQDQANLAKSFPECDDACYRMAEAQLSRIQMPR